MPEGYTNRLFVQSYTLGLLPIHTKGILRAANDLSG